MRWAMPITERSDVVGSISHSLIADQLAEYKLIKNLFDNPIIKESSHLIFLFSKFPIVPTYDRSEIICEIMKILWPEGMCEELFEYFREFELFLISIGKRDHFFHQFLVYLIGLNFIQVLISKCKNINISVESVFGFSDEAQIFRTWLFTATIHDFGYPYEFSKKISNKLSDLYKKFNMNQIADKFDKLAIDINISDEKILSQFILDDKHLIFGHMIETSFSKYSNIDDSLTNKLVKNLEDKRDHGLISAFILARIILENTQKKGNSITSFMKSDDYKSLEYAMSAITLHNIPESYQSKISFTKNIYSYLLFMLDNIQDWARDFISNNNKYPTYKMVAFDVDSDNSKISIDYYLQSNSWTKEMIREAIISLESKKKSVNAPEGSRISLGMKFIVRYFIFGQEKPVDIQWTF